MNSKQPVKQGQPGKKRHQLFWFVAIWILSITALAIITMALKGFFLFINGWL